DKSNSKPNPYQHLSLEQINRLYFLFAFLALGSSLLSPHILPTSVAVIAILLIGYFYSHPKFIFSHKPIPKFLSMTLTYTFIPAFLGTYPHLNNQNIYSILALCSMASSFFLYTDIRDIKGDLLHHKHTIANTLGVKHTTIIAALGGMLSYLFLITSLAVSTRLT